MSVAARQSLDMGTACTHTIAATTQAELPPQNNSLARESGVLGLTATYLPSR